jgi:hypothetical protein
MPLLQRPSAGKPARIARCGACGAIKENIMATEKKFSIAVLDDYQNVAVSMADWSVLEGRATITVFNDHLADADAVVARLMPFDVVCK